MLVPLDPRLRGWALGMEGGIGAALEEGRLTYRDVYGIDDPEALIFLLEGLAAWAAQLVRVPGSVPLLR